MYSQNCRRGSCQSGLPRAAACGTHGRPFEAACGGVGGGAGLAAHAQALGRKKGGEQEARPGVLACHSVFAVHVHSRKSKKAALGSSPVHVHSVCAHPFVVHEACCMGGEK
eukprot:1146901-Pelagomonas_calceolata.AAC.6